MLTNSLFKDFLVENGLDIYKDESTRDIIGIEFNFGTRDFEKEMKHIASIAKKAQEEYEDAVREGYKNQIDKKYNKKKKIFDIYINALKNRKIYHKLSKDEIRNIFYVNGVDIPYIFKKRNGDIKKVEVLHYKMLFRSTGKAKKGSCMFIREELYEKAKDFLYQDLI